MNPKLFTLFPLLTDETLKNVEVEKIALSKRNRTLQLRFPSSVSEQTAKRACETLKALYQLKSADYVLTQKTFDADKNISITPA